MTEKKIIHFDQNDARDHSPIAKRKFIIRNSLAVTNVWKSQMYGESMVDDF
jgi:hypothetical protein